MKQTVFSPSLRGKWLQAASYAIGSVVLGLLAVWLGMRLARIF